MNRITSPGVEAALRRFPRDAESVCRLAETSEAFRDMCEELAVTEAAEQALSAGGTTREGTARRLECEGWIARLVEEMSLALRQAKVIPLSGRNRR